VGIAYHYAGLEAWELALTAIAPVAGHAFTPFLRFQGGKALAVTFGVWTGLTLWLVPLTMGLLFALCLVLLKPEGWAILLGLIGLLVALIAFGSEPAFLAIWLGTSAILLWMQRDDLAQRPYLRRRSAAT
jgi:glycerol-3-phosphate acyltransferase PlsY